MTTSVIALGSLLALAGCSAHKPRVWVVSDLSDPQDHREGGHPQTDPDDIVSMAALLLEANRFEIEGIVVGSTNRKNLRDPMPFVQEVLLPAYEHDAAALRSELDGFQQTLPFLRSSITRTAEAMAFDPAKDYSDLSGLETVGALVEAAREGPIHVLCWGPVTEPAMAVKHLLDTGDRATLANMTFVAHWTKSYIAQGTPETPFEVANCRDDAVACAYMHEIAAELPEVKYVELGSVGQKGIVDGSDGFPDFDAFEASRLGQIFIGAKFAGGKPDQSDASTMWALTGEFGVGLADYAQNGSLDQATEERNRDKFHDAPQGILRDLLARARIAGKAGTPFDQAFLAERFTHVFRFLNGRYYIQAPYALEYQFLTGGGQTARQGRLARGRHEIDVSELAQGEYVVTLACCEGAFQANEPLLIE